MFIVRTVGHQLPLAVDEQSRIVDFRVDCAENADLTLNPAYKYSHAMVIYSPDTDTSLCIIRGWQSVATETSTDCARSGQLIFTGKIDVLVLGEAFLLMIRENGELSIRWASIESAVAIEGRWKTCAGSGNDIVWAIDELGRPFKLLIDPVQRLVNIEALHVESRSANKEATFARVRASEMGFAFFINDRYQVYAIGRNTRGQLGLGDTKDRSELTRLDVFDPLPVYDIAVGYWHTLFLVGTDMPRQDKTEEMQDGKEVYSCGWNHDSALFSTDKESRLWPEPCDVCAMPRTIYAGGRHSIVRDEDGRSYSTGWNAFGQHLLEDDLKMSGMKMVDIYCSHWSTHIVFGQHLGE